MQLALSLQLRTATLSVLWAWAFQMGLLRRAAWGTAWVPLGLRRAGGARLFLGQEGGRQQYASDLPERWTVSGVRKVCRQRLTLDTMQVTNEILMNGTLTCTGRRNVPGGGSGEGRAHHRATLPRAAELETNENEHECQDTGVGRGAPRCLSPQVRDRWPLCCLSVRPSV